MDVHQCLHPILDSLHVFSLGKTRNWNLIICVSNIVTYRTHNGVIIDPLVSSASGRILIGSSLEIPGLLVEKVVSLGVDFDRE